MSTSPLIVRFPGLNGILPEKAASFESTQSFRFEIAFLNRSSQWMYKFQQGLKRGFDLVAACFGLLLISPLLLGIALLIKSTSSGPILYKSERIGKNFKPFYMYKFRTMSQNADALREALRKETSQENGLFKLANDPRVTGVGKVLRALSLDELPQLLNVIRGEMSLVGPRPLPADESELFEDPYTLRFQVFPGMTGAWQVNGRSNTNFEQLCKLEMQYVMDWTFLTDLKIIGQTFPAVFASRGAY